MKTALAILITTIALTQSFHPAFAAAGDYIVTDLNCDCLRSVDHITGAVSNVASGLVRASYGVAVDSNGNYIVTNPYDGTLLSVDHATGAVSTIASGLVGAAGIAIDSNRNYVVTDSTATFQRLYVVDHVTDMVTTTATTGAYCRFGVAVDSNGNYIVSAEKINDCGPNTEYFLALVNHTGGAAPIVYSNQGNNPICYISTDIGVPEGVTIDSNGNYIVTDRWVGRLFSVTPAGGVTLIASGLGEPAGVAIASNGNYIVTDPNGHRLLSVTPSGAVTTIASNGLVYPWGIAIERAIPTVTSSSPFRITAISRQTNDIRITWQTIIGSTNELQATGGDVDGSYSTNNFSALFSITNVLGTTTNYLDVGGATNTPSRYYRVRLVP